MDISQRIFELAEKKYSQKEFAEVLGVKPQRISEWKRGLSCSYQKRLPQIAEALGTTTEYLLTGEGPQKRPVSADVSDSGTLSKNDLKAAFFEGGEDLTPEEMDELWEDAREYIQYKIAQRRKKRDE